MTRLQALVAAFTVFASASLVEAQAAAGLASGTAELSAARSNPAAARWYASLDEASAVARESNRPLLVDFRADWCEACKVMDRDVYPTEEFARAAESFTLVRVDSDHRTDLSRRYRVAALPTLLFADSYGTELFRVAGYLGVKPIAELLKSLPHDVTEFNRLSRILAADKNHVVALTEMAGRLRAVGLYLASNDYYARALQRQGATAPTSAREPILSAMAANYLEVKDGKHAVEALQRCLREFPNSPNKEEWTANLARARAVNR